MAAAEDGRTIAPVDTIRLSETHARIE